GSILYSLPSSILAWPSRMSSRRGQLNRTFRGRWYRWFHRVRPRQILAPRKRLDREDFTRGNTVRLVRVGMTKRSQ
ncbi:hypothetical protein FOZ62_032442, partial [Perkinsus olseni]